MRILLNSSTIVTVVVVVDGDTYHSVNLCSHYPFQVNNKVRQVLLQSATEQSVRLKEICVASALVSKRCQKND